MTARLQRHLDSLRASDATDVEFRVAAGLTALAIERGSTTLLETHSEVGAYCGKSGHIVKKMADDELARRARE